MLENLYNSTEFYEFLLNNITTAVFLVDSEFSVKAVNESLKSLLGKEENDIINQLCGNSLGCAFAVEENKPCGTTSKCSTCTLRECISGSLSGDDSVKKTYISRVFYIGSTPVEKHFRIKSRKILYKNENLAVITVDDITELEEQKKQIASMANTDFLTGLYSRRYLFEAGIALFNNAKRSNLRLSTAMIDIDHFKKVNDTFGHAAGDHILSSVSSIFKKNLRKSDIVARYGGEEFCIIMIMTGSGESFKIIEKIRKLAEKTCFVFDNNSISITLSCGLTDNIEATFDETLRTADQLLYRAKAEGRNRTVHEKSSQS